jgi:Domain of unknown function (DUF4249)
MKRFYQYIFGFLILSLGCVKPYEPAVLTGVNNFLVVDGIINCGPDAVTAISLSRTRSLSDTVTFLSEPYGQVFIEDQGGTRYPLQERVTGRYVSLPLNLNPSNQYRLNITTADGANYLSDFVPVKNTPPLDSLTWKQHGDSVTIYLSTHDAQNNTRYYRWEYEEDWEYAAFYDTNLAFRNGKVVFLTPAEQMFRCWKHDVSTEILLHSTVQLSQDLVIREPIKLLPAQSTKLERRYSLLARQFALTREAYEYWQILQKNTQQLGGLFGVQPSQLIGNIHNSKHADEPVIGFVTAATAQEQRLFIRRSEIRNGYSPMSSCTAFIVPGDSAAYYLADPKKAPAYYVTGGGLAISEPRCVDCRLEGGTTTKPSFWP